MFQSPRESFSVFQNFAIHCFSRSRAGRARVRRNLVVSAPGYGHRSDHGTQSNAEEFLHWAPPLWTTTGAGSFSRPSTLSSRDQSPGVLAAGPGEFWVPAKTGV